MRIAFVSDIHGNLAALDAVIADIARRGVHEVVNLGDTLSGPLLVSVQVPPSLHFFFINQRFAHKPEFIKSLKSAVFSIKTGRNHDFSLF